MAYIFDFQLLADGAAGGGAETAPDNSLGEITGGEQFDGKTEKGDFDAGNQKSTEGSGQSDPAARAKEFETLIKGEFKAQFDSKVQGIIDRRFKAQKSAMEEHAAAKPIIDMLMQRYGLKNIDELKSAFESDSLYWETGAEKEGLEVEQYKELMKLRAENQQYRQQQEMTEQQRFIRSRIEEWQRQGDELKNVYSDFDLQTELENRDFKGLLNVGIPMKQAYELVHMEEIQAAIKEKAERAVMDHIRANGSRPTENGVKNSNGFVLGKNVSELTKADRDEIKRRVQRGEKIIL